MKVRGQHRTNRIFKRGGELRSPRLSSYNKFNVLATQIDAGTSDSEGNKREEKVRKMERKPLREVTIKIGLKRLDT